jgi:hypothetical protein
MKRALSWMVVGAIVIAWASMTLLVAFGEQPAKPVLVEFTADWCKPCAAMAPIVAKLEARGHTVRRFNCTGAAAYSWATNHYGLAGLPTFIVYVEGREVARHVGACSEAELVKMFLAKPRPVTHTVNALAGYRTRNFVVAAPTADVARQVGDRAERARREMAQAWLGAEMPKWAKPCPVTVKLTDSTGGGQTSFVFDAGEVFGWSMDVQGTLPAVLESVIPHEVTHAVLATHFRRQLPRWADEGAATSTEPADYRTAHSAHLVDMLRTGQALPFNQLFALTEYPADVATFYAQGYSVAEFLIQHNGRPGFVAFLEDQARDGTPAALAANYDYRNLADLQTAWLEWVKAGSPIASKPATQLAAFGQKPCPCYRWWPGKRLWQVRPGWIFPKARRTQPGGPTWPTAPPIDPKLGPSLEAQGGTFDQTAAPASTPPDHAPPGATPLPAQPPDGLTTAPPAVVSPPAATPAPPALDVTTPTPPAVKAVEHAAEAVGTKLGTDALMAIGLGAGPAGVIAAGATWLIMRRGKKKLNERISQLESRGGDQSAAGQVGNTVLDEIRQLRAKHAQLQSDNADLSTRISQLASAAPAVVERADLKLQTVPTTDHEYNRLLEAMRREVAYNPQAAPVINRVQSLFEQLGSGVVGTQDKLRLAPGSRLGWNDPQPAKG